ncbi:MAG: pseudouridine synthase [Mycoplasmataceae bacterium]|nr:pseudouridine synthase [Mycoplasmataceae bacterium]
MNHKKPERISKLVSNYGNYSRRQVDFLIKEQKVFVNNKVAILGQKITIDDDVYINEQKVSFRTRHLYYALNKPKGFICEREDKEGKEVISLLPEFRKRNLFTIGRLDVNTTGLIIVTTDGGFAQKVNDPKSKINKTYLVFLKKKLSSDNIKALSTGIVLDDGYTTKPVAKVKMVSNKDGNIVAKLTITEGKKNQVKRMFIALDNEVINLKRISIGQLQLGSIPLGDYKTYQQQEIFNLLNVQNNI